VAFEYLLEKIKVVGKRSGRRTGASPDNTEAPGPSTDGGLRNTEPGAPGAPKVVAAIFMPPTTYLSKERLESTVVDWTVGEEPIIEHSGVREEIFTLRGTSAYQARLGQDKDGKDLFAIGPELFKEIDKFFAEYQEQTNAEEMDTGKQQHSLIFHALDEEQDRKVEVVRWFWFRNTDQERFTYGWELTLKRVGKASPRKLSELEQFAEATREVAKAVDTISAAVATGVEYLEDINEALDSFREPLRSVLRITDQLDRVVSQSRRIVDFPMLMLRDVYHIAGAAADTLFGAYDALGPVVRDQNRPQYIDTMGRIAENRRLALGVLGRFSLGTGDAPDQQSPTPRATQLHSPQEVPVVEATVRRGWTLADLAGELLGDRSRWIEIAIINGWHSATVDPGGKPIQAGTKVLVPAAAGEGAKGSLESDRYGTDWRMVDGDMVPAGDDPTDWQTVTGPENFAQGLTIRLKSVQGESSAFPEIGLPELIGRRNTVTRLALTTSHMRTQLLLDPRVDSISSLQVVDGGDSYTLKAKVVATDGRNLTVVTPV
jgi:hypothetical protein